MKVKTVGGKKIEFHRLEKPSVTSHIRMLTATVYHQHTIKLVSTLDGEDGIDPNQSIRCIKT